jgi:hypothetical protein
MEIENVVTVIILAFICLTVVMRSSTKRRGLGSSESIKKDAGRRRQLSERNRTKR